MRCRMSSTDASSARSVIVSGRPVLTWSTTPAGVHGTHAEIGPDSDSRTNLDTPVTSSSSRQRRRSSNSAQPRTVTNWPLGSCTRSGLTRSSIRRGRVLSSRFKWIRWKFVIMFVPVDSLTCFVSQSPRQLRLSNSNDATKPRARRQRASRSHTCGGRRSGPSSCWLPGGVWASGDEAFGPGAACSPDAPRERRASASADANCTFY